MSPAGTSGAAVRGRWGSKGGCDFLQVGPAGKAPLFVVQRPGVRAFEGGLQVHRLQRLGAVDQVMPGQGRPEPEPAGPL